VQLIVFDYIGSDLTGLVHRSRPIHSGYRASVKFQAADVNRVKYAIVSTHKNAALWNFMRHLRVMGEEASFVCF